MAIELRPLIDLLTCERCGALVPTITASGHRQWHEALEARQTAPQAPLTANLDCAACNGTIAEIARLSDQLRAHQQVFAHRAVPGM